MKSPIVLDGPPADWDSHKKAMDALCESGGENVGAAMFADPGVQQCPGCEVYLWNEGWRVRCPECGHEFVTREGRWRQERGQYTPPREETSPDE